MYLKGLFAPNMQNITLNSQVKGMAVIIAVIAVFGLFTPISSAKASSYTYGTAQVYNPFNWYYGVNKNDPNYAKYVKAGVANKKTLGNYPSLLPKPKVKDDSKILYWDRPVTFYGVPPSPTHGASAITPTPPGRDGVYYEDLARAGGPVYVSGANYGNGQPVGRAIDTNGGRAITPGSYPR